MLSAVIVSGAGVDRQTAVDIGDRVVARPARRRRWRDDGIRRTRRPSPSPPPVLVRVTLVTVSPLTSPLVVNSVPAKVTVCP